MSYKPGAHIIASLHTLSASLLQHSAPVSQLLDELIRKYQLQKLGEVYHDFPEGGFTAVVCLSESHISLHSWPEYNLVNIDIYLSNFKRTNDGTVQEIYAAIINFFEAKVEKTQTIIR